MSERKLVHVDVCPCKKGRMLVEYYDDGTVTLAPKSVVHVSFPTTTGVPTQGSGECIRKWCHFTGRAHNDRRRK